jgi:predicted RNA-binding Zn-ribbon protein involved in translation (DUF1610 family)
MLKVDAATLTSLEAQYPGIEAAIKAREAEVLPPCPHCGSDDIARLEVGVVGRTIAMTAATTRFKLRPNGPKPGEFFCNACEAYFDLHD